MASVTSLSAAEKTDTHKTIRDSSGDEASVRPTILIAVAFVILEQLVAVLARLPLWPFAVCAFFFLIAIIWVSQQRAEVSTKAGRALALTLLVKTFAVCVGISGGAQSPFSGILFLPVFLGALYFGRWGALTVGAAISVFLISLLQLNPDDELAHRAAWTQSAVFLVVSVATGYFTHRLRATAAEAAARAQEQEVRAREQERRASEFEWFTDTAVMMQSLYDLEHMLSAALLRLDDLLPNDGTAIFLREPDDPQMSLAQTIGIRNADVGLRSLSLADQTMFQSQEPIGILIADTQAPGAEARLGAFKRFDSRARSIIVAPLRTMDDLFGVICVVSHNPNQFTERDSDLLMQFAKHVVYPIQRVRLQAMATTDALTGLHNRRAFRMRLGDEVQRARRYEHSLSLVMIDIDYFKRANDTFGHRAGDAILTQIGGILLRSSRTIDFAARYGGEEMAVLCPETGKGEAQALGERIRANVEAYRLELPDGKETHVTVSVGVAALPLDAEDGATLVEAADRALFRAKEGGRNQVCVAVEKTALPKAAGKR
jgi:diguanylate cyclase (GGDEF)-like protein